MARLFNDASTEYLKVEQAVLSGVPISISIWFRRDADIECVLFSLVDKDSDVNAFFIQCLASGDSNQVRVLTRDSGGYGIATTSTGTTDNVWQHVLAVFAANNDRRVYLNGGGKGTNATARTPANMDRTAIGYWARMSPLQYFSGDIAEVAIWNGILTDADAASLAKGFSPRLVQPNNLAAHWNLIRGLNDNVGGYNLTASGTSVSDHPRIIVPSRKIIIPNLEIDTLRVTADIVLVTDADAKKEAKLNTVADITLVTDIINVVEKTLGVDANLVLITDVDAHKEAKINADAAIEIITAAKVSGKSYINNIYINGAAAYQAWITTEGTLSGAGFTVSQTEVVYLLANDYVEIYGYQNSGGSIIILGDIKYTSLAIHRLS